MAGVDREGVGELRIESELRARIAKGGGKFKDIGGAAARESGHSIELRFQNKVVIAECREDRGDALGVVCGKSLSGRVGGDPRTDLSGGVGHGADAVTRFWESGLYTTEGRAGKDGEDEGISGGLREGGVDLGKLLRFASEDKGVSLADRGGEVGEVGDARRRCEFGAGGVVATGTGNRVWGVMVVL